VSGGAGADGTVLRLNPSSDAESLVYAFAGGIVFSITLQ
jgi:hypothetical protein